MFLVLATVAMLSMVNEIADQYDIQPELIEAIIETESSWDADAVSRSGAIGLMQIIPKWHGDRMERLGVTDITDPRSNVLVATDYLAELFETYEDPAEVLMIYNMGWAGVELFNQGYISKYAYKILMRSNELEKEHKQEAENGRNTFKTERTYCV